MAFIIGFILHYPKAAQGFIIIAIAKSNKSIIIIGINVIRIIFYLANGIQQGLCIGKFAAA